MNQLSNIRLKAAQFKRLRRLVILLLTMMVVLMWQLQPHTVQKKVSTVRSHLTGVEDVFDKENIVIYELRAAQEKLQKTIASMESRLNMLAEKPVHPHTDFVTKESLAPRFKAINEQLMAQALILNQFQMKQKTIETPQKTPTVIAPLTVNLTPKPNQNEVPAGSHVRAVLIGAVDVGAGVTAQSEAKPLLLRITEAAVLPNYKRRDLKGCTVIARGYGDISSERVYARLVTMSCIKPDGTVFESAVRGNLFGSAGKYGIRGRVVRRETAALTHASLFGALSGLANGLSQSISGGRHPAENMNQSALLKYSLNHGANTALDKLAAYHIKRAEQYQPIIQIDPGVVVDIVFTAGFSMNGEKKAIPYQSNIPSAAQVLS